MRVDADLFPPTDHPVNGPDRQIKRKLLHAFVEREALPGTGISTAAFWSGLADLVHDSESANRQLLEVRDSLQARVDAYLRDVIACDVIALIMRAAICTSRCPAEIHPRSLPHQRPPM
jgi:hypothetical protein